MLSWKPLIQTSKLSVFLCRLLHCCQPRGGQGQGRGGRSVQSFGNEVHAGRTCVCTSHVKMPVLARVLPFFFFFFLGILSPSTHIFYSTPPKQNTTSLANEKDPHDKEARHTVVACNTTSYYSLLYSSLPHISIINYVSFPCSVCVKHVQLSCWLEEKTHKPVEHNTHSMLLNHREGHREGDWVTSCAPTLS